MGARLKTIWGLYVCNAGYYCNDQTYVIDYSVGGEAIPYENPYLSFVFIKTLQHHNLGVEAAGKIVTHELCHQLWFLEDVNIHSVGNCTVLVEGQTVTPQLFTNLVVCSLCIDKMKKNREEGYWFSPKGR